MLPIVLLTLQLGSVTRAEVPHCDFQCKTVRILAKFTGDDVEIADGVRLVRIGGNDTGRTTPDSTLTALQDFAGRYDLRVKLSRFLPAQEDVISGLRSAFAYLSGNEARGDGGGKKGGGMLMMATMMGGTVAALGFGALGMLAMKALTVSAMALMLSVIMGLKRLLSKHEHESGHIVSYVPVHHGSRRRRTLFGYAETTYEVGFMLDNQQENSEIVSCT